MSATSKENVEERIERIRKRQEEIEKKHREAELDRLMALQDNAMVKTKSPKDDDWPKGHKYDKIDFTYDVAPEKLEEIKSRKQEDILPSGRSKRDYKKFANGEGPPPDPIYNFLADAERDGIPLQASSGQKSDGRTDRKDNYNGKFAGNNNNNNSNSNRNKDLQQPQQQRRGGQNNSSFRNNSRNNGKPQNNQKYSKQNSQPEYEQWRNERERIDDARIMRQKSCEGKWRREWDNQKVNGETEAANAWSERNNLVEFGGTAKEKRSPTHQVNSSSKNHSDFSIEKRGNVTVSITQSGEVKSVKLSSAPIIGTGRVGPRQTLNKAQFSVQAIEHEEQSHQQQLLQHQHQQQINLYKNQQNNQNQIIQQHAIPQRNLARSLSPKTAALQFDQQMQTPPPAINHSGPSTPPISAGRPILGNANVGQLQQRSTPELHQQLQQQQMIPSKNQRKLNSPKYVASPASQQKSLSGNISGNKLQNSSGNFAVPAAPATADTAAGAEIISPVDLSHKPEFAKKSVQDRLLKARMAPSTVVEKLNEKNLIEFGNNDYKLAAMETSTLTERESQNWETNTSSKSPAINESIQLAACI